MHSETNNLKQWGVRKAICLHNAFAGICLPAKALVNPASEYLNFLIVGVCDVFTELVFGLDFTKWLDLAGEQSGAGVWGWVTDDRKSCAKITGEI